MIASTIIFKVPQDSDWNALRERAYQRAEEHYRHIEGLITKAFILNTKTGEYGGMYVWQDKKHLDALLTSDAFKGSVDKLGEPEIKIFEVPAFIDEGQVSA